MVRASDCQSYNSLGFDPPTQWNLRAAEEAVLNKVHKNPNKFPLKKLPLYELTMGASIESLTNSKNRLLYPLYTPNPLQLIGFVLINPIIWVLADV